MNKKYLLATACNEKYEEFLINHWLRSLKSNCTLESIDIVVIDYGLSENARKILKSEAVLIKIAGKFKGHINNTRFLELNDFLLENENYEQVVLCDSGDIIFQSDISHLFQLEPEKIKAVCEEISPNMEIVANDKNVKNADEIKKFLSDKKLINAGFVIYPRKQFVELVWSMNEIIRDLDAWGTDMVVLNYYAYKKDFYQLHPKYNFIPTTTQKKYKVKNGKFYLVENGKVELIPVVHNAGRHKLFRPILNFGYGESYNIPRPLAIFALRTFYQVLSLFKSKR
ncbi:MAG: hypothetical protein WHS64_07210 [Fervidobacterium sp.]|uniref:Glycosyltransferase n=2 Tax=Fervidobacterium TaxID=2422 RepID=A7HN16_FERNB|nr:MULTISPECIES: hypothetical protein [Fervidobacterium]ABS61299.1 conserved hypothetical protein [Fervidobacterium nodosum Rt17-B1]SHN66378.1 hypothetical protein SAMN02745226_01605 [Fervidobacterium gondwanense DSM 13020]